MQEYRRYLCADVKVKLKSPTSEILRTLNMGRPRVSCGKAPDATSGGLPIYSLAKSIKVNNLQYELWPANGHGGRNCAAKASAFNMLQSSFSELGTLENL